MSSVVVLGFFANRDEARSAAVELNRRRRARGPLPPPPPGRRFLIDRDLGRAARPGGDRLRLALPLPSTLPLRPGDLAGGLDGRPRRRPGLVPPHTLRRRAAPPARPPPPPRCR